MPLNERLTLMLRAGLVEQLCHPVPQPKRDAGAILARLRAKPA